MRYTYFDLDYSSSKEMLSLERVFGITFFKMEKEIVGFISRKYLTIFNEI
jgi:hypothetical protein